MATVWNPSDEVNVGLSVGNHVATGVANTNGAVRSIGSTHSSGKWYLELSGIVSSGGSSGFGIYDTSGTLTSGPDIYIDPGGTFHFHGGTHLTGEGAPDGHVVSFAIDFDNGLAWCRYDAGTWHGNSGSAGDPSSGLNGGIITGINLPQSIMAFLQSLAGQHSTCTINAGDSAFVNTVPAGFTGWDQPVIFRYAQSRVIF